MSLLGLLGRGFDGEPLAAPVLSVADKKDGTGAIATITGSDGGCTNVVRAAKVNELLFVDIASRSDDGTVDLPLTDEAHYLAFVVSTLGARVEISEMAAFYVTTGVARPFDQFRKNVLRRRVLSSDLFAEPVTYTMPSRPAVTITALCDHKDEIVMDGGRETLLETLRVTIARDAIACPPARGHKLRRADEDRDYVFVYHGRTDSDAYRVVFERRRVLSERLG